ncbi:hypothetical protein DCAR_0314305 [Daucus carota subsp. sativus]|uniref:NB-ARC domain-containing protein n=1 Tax=Daucus carota subsp. sativus TaxID=79200 RepID=A0AAF0WUS2_DAUCS|nr:PREDICTED: putative late blight resistance protein homolog R1A-10 [Daucus carota subsp. sativus]WOG95003.1 hypothetical protein DCAR_0314305 [Daucus carota subsp. sativus]
MDEFFLKRRRRSGYGASYELIHTSPSEFRATVQRFTGHSNSYNLFDRCLEELNRLLSYTDCLLIQRCQISCYCRQLRLLSKEFRRTLTTCHESYLSELLTDPTLHILVTRIIEHKILGSRSSGFLDFSQDLNAVGGRIAFEVAVIYKACSQDFDKASKDLASRFYFDKKTFQEYEEVLVGFQEEANSLLQQLASITKKRLQVISIVGMAGNGKTTLVRKLYNDPYVVSYFHVRAWVTCSQVYDKRDLLLAILRSVVEITDEVYSKNDGMLAHDVYRALKGRRYLIVADDIWSNEAWDDLKRSFPDDNMGSRIMLTTRLKDVALHAQTDGHPLCLRFLTEKESIDLFGRKAFVTTGISSDFIVIGMRIARKCHGLPLAIVVIAGLLKNNLKIDWWAHAEESLSSYIVTDESQFMDTLALSYNNLPQHLRSCFLFFGAFPEDHDVPVRKLIWLWIAEGFIHHNDTEKNLEDVAENYLMDLIGRSLVVAGRKGSNGAIKTCHIHDLLRDLCLKKIEKENFSPNIYNYNRFSHSLTNSFTESQLLLSPNVLPGPSTSSWYCPEFLPSFFKEKSIAVESSKFIRVLDLSSIELFAFPSELLQLVRLRYLEIRFRSGNLPESISDLTELLTLIISSKKNVFVHKNIWKMINLRHLCIKTGKNVLKILEEEPGFLENLQTLSLVSPARLSPIVLARIRNLKKLGLCGPLTTKCGEFKLPDLGLLMHLEILKLFNTTVLCNAGRLSNSIIFPETLKKLTVSNTCLDWTEAWVFQMIPKLEVLKLKFHAFVGKYWETSPNTFPSLRLLKLDELDVENWTGFRDHFPVLQRLQVWRCPCLLEIPEDFGNICTLEWIELSGCNHAAKNSAREIQKEQERNGNDSLKILHPSQPWTNKSHTQEGRSGQ